MVYTPTAAAGETQVALETRNPISAHPSDPARGCELGYLGCGSVCGDQHRRRPYQPAERQRRDWNRGAQRRRFTHPRPADKQHRIEPERTPCSTARVFAERKPVDNGPCSTDAPANRRPAAGHNPGTNPRTTSAGDNSGATAAGNNSSSYRGATGAVTHRATGRGDSSLQRRDLLLLPAPSRDLLTPWWSGPVAIA